MNNLKFFKVNKMVTFKGLIVQIAKKTRQSRQWQLFLITGHTLFITECAYSVYIINYYTLFNALLRKSVLGWKGQFFVLLM